VTDEPEHQGNDRPTSSRGRSGNVRARIAVLSVALWGASGLAVLLLYGSQHWDRPATWTSWTALPALTLGFILTEVFVVHVRIRADAHTFSLVELPLAFGLFFAQPQVVIVAQIVGAGLALRFHRKQGPLKLLFNTAVFASTGITAIAVMRFFAPNPFELDQGILLRGAGALLVEAILSVGLVFVVISISARSWRLADLRSSLGFGVATATFTISLGIIAVVVVDAQPGVAWMLIIPICGTYLANWLYTTQRRRHEGLDFLYQSTKLLHQSSELESAIVELLRHTCATFNAASAELIYITERGGAPVRVRVGPSDLVQSLESVELDPDILDGLLTNRETSIHRTAQGSAKSDFIDWCGYDNAIVAPLLSAQRVVGVLVIANRLNQVVGFDAADVRLAETLANQTMTALENGRLEQSLEQLRVLEGQLTYQASHDPLTGLANRTLFRAALAETIDRYDGRPGAVMFIDLDDFKVVNDSFGHAAGDALLIEVAARLRSCVAEPAEIARLGGDEFAVLLKEMDDPFAASKVANNILVALEVPALVGSRRLDIRASIGIALVEKASDPEAMMRNADTAMYAAKGRGKHAVVMFEPSMYESNLNRFYLHNDLQRAITGGELVLHYQPIIRFGTGALLGVEGLVRWNHPSLGLLSPSAFLHLAEETGLLASIDMMMLDHACAWLAKVDETDAGLIPWVNVNLAPQNFHQPDLIAHILETLHRHGLSADRIGIEVTENLLSEHADHAIETITRLNSIGLRVALDDFGTGYSSLSYLQSMPVSVIKIAQVFVDNLESSDSQRDLTGAIIGLSAALDKFVIAEGIERPEQAALLESLGCDAGQGYHFARPMEGDAFLTWARRWPRDRAVSTQGRVDSRQP
jgi:diguanylate cyclase (GGDEF)-like protein